MIYDVGDQVQLTTVIRDLTGATVNTPTVALTVTKPDATTTSPTVTNTGSGGVYTAQVTVDQAGTWTYVWTASGTVVAVEASQFEVAAQRVLVASLEEFKNHLRRTDITDDGMLRMFLTAATDWVERTIGGPVSVQTFSEKVAVANWWIQPSQRPLVSVTSLTPELGSALDSSAYVVDTLRNAIRVRWGIFTGWYSLVYTAGLAAIPERVKLAGLIVAEHLWEVENGGGGMPFPGESENVWHGQGFAVPRRAQQLLAADMIPGFA